ncbi:hypothetical protein HPB50_028872 [Hyalomma asiaticum]|nr:hypothetical protein HPB50_028872 [Hyalomma asiaticum]
MLNPEAGDAQDLTQTQVVFMGVVVASIAGSLLLLFDYLLRTAGTRSCTGTKPCYLWTRVERTAASNVTTPNSTLHPL